MSCLMDSAPCAFQRKFLEGHGFTSEATGDLGLAAWSGHGIAFEVPASLDDPKTLMVCVVEAAKKTGSDQRGAAIEMAITGGRALRLRL